MAQLVECLPRKHEVLNSNPPTKKTKKAKQKQKQPQLLRNSSSLSRFASEGVYAHIL
jgi:hypothetical protein